MAAFISYFTCTQQLMSALIRHPENCSVPPRAPIADAPDGTLYGVYIEAGAIVNHAPG